MADKKEREYVCAYKYCLHHGQKVKASESVVIKKKNDPAAEEKCLKDNKSDTYSSGENSETGTSKEKDTSERKRIYPFEKRNGSSYGRVGETGERHERGAWRSDRDSKRKGGFGGKRGREGFSDRYQKRGAGDASFSGGKGYRAGNHISVKDRAVLP